MLVTSENAFPQFRNLFCKSAHQKCASNEDLCCNRLVPLVPLLQQTQSWVCCNRNFLLISTIEKWGGVVKRCRKNWWSLCSFSMFMANVNTKEGTLPICNKHFVSSTDPARDSRPSAHSVQSSSLEVVSLYVLADTWHNAKLIDNFSHESDVTFLRTPF